MESTSYRGNKPATSYLGGGHLPFFSALFFLCINITIPLNSLANVIYPNTALTPSSSSPWTSPSGAFSMGFFSFLPQTYYVGIWLSSIPSNQNIVWTANRYQSVPTNSTLRFTADGQLLLTTLASNIFQISDVSNASQAELLDTGNFVLRDNTSNVIWQSFDHPTDTLLPSQNFTSSSNPFLVPWISSEDPSPSTKYSLVFGTTAGPVGHIRLLYQNSNEYWSEPPPGVNTTLFNTTISIDATGTISLFNGDGSLVWSNASCNPTSKSLTKLQLSVDGNLRVLTWSNTSKTWDSQWRALYLQCDVYGTCGDNSICDKDQDKLSVGGGGCPFPEAQSSSLCSCPQGFTRNGSSCSPPSSLNCSQYMSIIEHTSFGVPGGLQSTFSSISQKDCEGKCLSDCACTGASYDTSSSACWQYNSTLFNGVTFAQTDETSFIKTVNSSFSSATNSNDSGLPAYAIALIVVAASLILLLFSGLLIIRHQIRSRFPRFKEVLLDPDVLNAIGGPNRFSFEDLYMATRGFHEENQLGAGGFGTVYKGTFTTLGAGKLDVAIKRLHKSQRQAYEEDHGKENSDFSAEIEILGSIRHVNVVSLMGFCAEGPERLLVYELVANGSLSNHILAESSVLSWDARFQIAVGAATGIEYLHAHCPKKIVHRDIKPDNILIDEDYRAKVADFGVSQILDKERAHLTNNSLRGTWTYMAPECLQVGALLTEKADVYSYGVVLLELVSGRRVTKEDYNEGGGEGEENAEMKEGQGRKRRKLPLEQAVSLMGKGKWGGLIDERLEGVCNGEEAERLVRIVFWCLQGKPDHRPCTEDLLLMIKGHKAVPPPPLLGLFDFHHHSLAPSSSNSHQPSIVLPDHLSQGR